ncbi:glycosyltransferase [Kineothrix sp. MSJ-39]|uniref:CgeB family protein n=1 Tax=Kineothrix sp. MSJ-39 TaxID=2841533 RepID=UPI001C10D1AA|nr:DUF3880 domain-containing protein [Kineothrix sp. MSJ-39]MBU5430974.1 glycosyltransferase [Kineothrix sp. MSJ-39]
MKVLFLEWNSYGNEFLKHELRRMGNEILELKISQASGDMRAGKEETEKIANSILLHKPDFVFSFNYFPVAAIACKACRTKYVSWVYDSPYILLYSKTVFYQTNYIFIFDRYETEKLKKLGVNTVYYLPMASATFYYDKKVPDVNRKMKYSSDITFIGSMYSEKKQRMFRHMEKLDEETKGYVDALINIQKNLYGIDVIEKALTPDVMDKIDQVCPITVHGDGLETKEWVIANYFLAREVTAVERRELLYKLSSGFDVKLFTPERTDYLPQITNMGKIDYYEEAPYAIKCAKINLNVSLKSIHSGIPLRVLDILGCGGFLLTNYQEDMFEYLEPDKDFVYYESVEHACDLADYYLQHDEERIKIAENGYRKVKQNLTYEKQLERILHIIM